MSARNTSSPGNVQNGQRPKPGGWEKRCQQTPIRQHVGPTESAQTKRTGETGGSSRGPAPTHPLYMPHSKTPRQYLAPADTPSKHLAPLMRGAREWVQQLLTRCLALGILDACSGSVRENSPRQHFGPAERAQTKRTGETGGNSHGSAPTHPLYMPHSKTPRQNFGPAVTPRQHLAPLMRGAREWVQQLLTWRLALGILDACSGSVRENSPCQNFGPAERVQRASGPRSMSARNTSFPGNVQKGPLPKPGWREKRHSPPARPPFVERQLTHVRVHAKSHTSRQAFLLHRK